MNQREFFDWSTRLIEGESKMHQRNFEQKFSAFEKICGEGADIATLTADDVRQLAHKGRVGGVEIMD